VDVWLDVACLFKTRSEAHRALSGGKVDVNGSRARPHRDVRPGDRIAITRPGSRRQEVVVRATTDRHVPRSAARALYEDVTPPPSPAEQAMRDLLRAVRQSAPSGPAPGRRDRRALRKLKGRL
jgi:ribosome-associated heat shock protein Hsp15